MVKFEIPQEDVTPIEDPANADKYAIIALDDGGSIYVLLKERATKKVAFQTLTSGLGMHGGPDYSNVLTGTAVDALKRELEREYTVYGFTTLLEFLAWAAEVTA